MGGTFVVLAAQMLPHLTGKLVFLKIYNPRNVFPFGFTLTNQKSNQFSFLNHRWVICLWSLLTLTVHGSKLNHQAAGLVLVSLEWGNPFLVYIMFDPLPIDKRALENILACRRAKLVTFRAPLRFKARSLRVSCQFAADDLLVFRLDKELCKEPFLGNAAHEWIGWMDGWMDE